MKTCLSKNEDHLTWAEIDLSALKHNLEMVRSQLRAGTRIMAVVKADAYGHGAVEVSRTLADCGVDALAVATTGEAVQLRENQIKLPILVLAAWTEKDLERLFVYNLIPALNSWEAACRLNEYGCRRGQRIKAHLRIDTGMGSYGLLGDECLHFMDTLIGMEYLELEGIFTHLTAIYGGKKEDALEQLRMFEQLLVDLSRRGINLPVVHASSSPAMLRIPEAEYDMVRPGIVLYGLPCGNKFLDDKIKPVMQIKTRVVALKKVGCNFGVGYGRTFITNKPTCIATLPVGYAYASFLHCFCSGAVLLHGKRAPVIGKSGMDHLIVNVSHIDDAAVGDEVVILGEQNKETINAAEIARHADINVNNCDLVCLLSCQVPRVYIGKSTSITSGATSYSAGCISR